MPSVLLILPAEQAEKLLASLGKTLTITQRFPPRLVIVEGPSARLAGLKRLPAIVVLAEGPVPQHIRDQLTNHEQLFVDGWMAGRKSKGMRPGEGLPWDAEGYEPP